MKKWVILGMLLAASIYDLKYKIIPAWLILLSLAGGLAYSTIEKVSKKEWIFWAAGTVLILSFCAITKQAFGYGDGIMWSVTILYVGITEAVKLWMISLGVSFFFSVLALILKKADRNTTFPFLPFVTVVYSTWIMIGD